MQAESIDVKFCFFPSNCQSDKRRIADNEYSAEKIRNFERNQGVWDSGRKSRFILFLYFLSIHFIHLILLFCRQISSTTDTVLFKKWLKSKNLNNNLILLVKTILHYFDTVVIFIKNIFPKLMIPM